MRKYISQLIKKEIPIPLRDKPKGRGKYKLSAQERENPKLQAAMPQREDQTEFAPENLESKSWEYEKVAAAMGAPTGEELPRNDFYESHLQRLLKLRGESLGEPLKRNRKRIGKYGY